MTDLEPVTPNPWQALRRYTNARIALGRVGDSLPTTALLAFQADHAEARDAVHLPFAATDFADQCAAQGLAVLRVQSAAPDRATYLKRPDLGRRLSEPSANLLTDYATAHPGPYDAVLVIADGLSARAVHAHAVAVATGAAHALAGLGWRLAPIVIAEQGRVALGDAIGELLGAEQVALLIGERPGLSVADSLGIYLTYAPRVGRTDAERNCISNIHAQGLSYAAAQATLLYLMTEARRRKLTGVELKDDRAEVDQQRSLPQEEA
jgi:ethanolamine ammonia-lyase small subunit